VNLFSVVKGERPIGKISLTKKTSQFYEKLFLINTEGQWTAPKVIMKFSVTCFITKQAGHTKIARKIDTSRWKQRSFPPGLCSTMNRTVLCYVQQAATHLALASPVILAMTFGSSENLHSICLRLRCLKVDAQSNKERKQTLCGRGASFFLHQT
jgi:hypothetical protein